MGIVELFIIAVGLSMDAFAVSICKGLSVTWAKPRHMITTGLYFGIFQAGMPVIGYFLGVQFQSFIVNVDHWIAFVLLSLIGLNMVLESRKEAECENSSFKMSAMLPLAVATSIDALAIGVTFAFLKVNIAVSACFIGIITFILSAAGVKIGNVFGCKYKSKAELLGGVVLLLMGIKILLEHLGVLNF